MKIQVRGKNIPVTDALREYTEKRVKKLNRFLDGFREAQVVLSVQRDNHTVEVTTFIDSGMILRGEETTDDMYASVDLVVDKLEKQIERYKGRLIKRNRVASNASSQEGYKEDKDEPKVVRTKRFAVKPMSADEAILQMNLLGHSFFVFRNADTEEVNVLYLRNDGDYGLIEPDY